MIGSSLIGEKAIGSSRINILFVFDFEGSGGFVLGGEAPRLFDYIFTAEGGVVLSGEDATTTLDVILPVSGGLTFSGIGVMIPQFDFLAEGGFVLAGEDTTTEIDVEMPAGGVVTFTGVAVTKAEFNFEGAGGIVLTGDRSEPEGLELNFIAEGGISLSGDAEVIPLFDFIASGGIVFSGEAVLLPEFIIEPEGGITLGGGAGIIIIDGFKSWWAVEANNLFNNQEVESMSNYYRGVAIPGFTFGLLSVVDASSIVDGIVTGYITKDAGTQVELVNSAGGTGINHLGNGQWTVAITAEETDATTLGIIFIHPIGINTNFTIPIINAPTPLQQTLTPGDPTTEIGKVRIWMEDTNGEIFTDLVVQFFLDENAGDIYYAAADGLEVMASGAAQKAWMIRTGSTTQDFRRTTVELRNQAAALRERGDSFPQFETVERDVSIFSSFEIYLNRIQREGV